MGQLNETNMSLSEKLEMQKNELGNDIKEKIQKMQDDKEKYEKKYNEK